MSLHNAPSAKYDYSAIEDAYLVTLDFKLCCLEWDDFYERYFGWSVAVL